MSVIDSTHVTDFSTRPRRLLQSPSKNYDGDGEKDLELRGILDVLGAYRDYEGGINCSKCGKLYKSKVCFIKHLWEHSIYWDLFPGEKNHERVLAIQAALILYSRYLNVTQEDADRLRDLLVTSPSGHEIYTSQPTPKKIQPMSPPAQRKMPLGPQVTPQKVPRSDLSTPKKPRTFSVLMSQSSHHQENIRPALYPLSPVTPEKDFDPVLVCPATPRKDRRKLLAAKSQRMVRRRRRLLLD